MRFILATIGLLALSIFGNDLSPPDVQVSDAVQFATPYTVGQAKNIVGIGTNGNDFVGPIMVFDGTGQDGIVINGVGAPFRGTGGSVENLRICRKGGTSGGKALCIVAIDTQQRPGEIALKRLKLFPEAALHNCPAGNWDDGIHIDGSALTTPGAQGVRRVTMDDIRIAGCNRRSIVLNNAVHCCMTNIQLDPGSAPTASMEIIGGQNIVGNNFIVNGDVIVGGNAVEVSMHGRFHTIRIGPNCRAVTFFGTAHYLYVEPGATGAFHGHVSGSVDNKSTAFAIH